MFEHTQKILMILKKSSIGGFNPNMQFSVKGIQAVSVSIIFVNHIQ